MYTPSADQMVYIYIYFFFFDTKEICSEFLHQFGLLVKKMFNEEMILEIYIIPIRIS